MRRLRVALFLASTLGLWFECGLSPAWAGAGTEGASFLDIPVGAGPAALGGDYTARAADVYGVVWNPAGLSRVQGTEVTAQHLEYLQSTQYEFAGGAVSLRPGSTLGAGIQYLGSGNIVGTDNFGNPTGNFTSHYAAYSLAFGQALGDQWSLGATSKFIEAQLQDDTAHAFAGDVGAQYRPNDQWTLALAAVNLGSSLTFLVKTIRSRWPPGPAFFIPRTIIGIFLWMPMSRAAGRQARMPAWSGSPSLCCSCGPATGPIRFRIFRPSPGWEPASA